MQLAGVYAEIYARLAGDSSLFPSLPDTAIRLRETLEQPSCDIPTVARLIKVDAALAAFIMRAASRVRYLTRVPPSDLESAVRRIGLRDTYNFVLAFLTRSSFESGSARLRALLAQAYQSATRTAVLCHHLASQVSGFGSGQAMLAGLLQDIGTAPILVCFADRDRLPADPAELEAGLDTLCPLVSVLILQQWGFGEDMLEVARARKQWFRDPQEQADLGDLVLIARLHAAMGTAAFRQCPPLTDLPAFTKLALGELTPNNSLRLVEDSREELGEIERLLTGAG